MLVADSIGSGILRFFPLLTFACGALRAYVHFT
jgi:hypothetical protein